MNALYVGVTRAVSNVYIIDDESNLLKIIEPKEKGNVNIKKEESSPEEWRNKALELIEKGNIEQAELIARKLQNEGKKEYAEEIMNVLKAKEYHKELQNNKHTNSVLESDISSRSSQNSEHEGDDISKPQSKESRHNKNKKKKAKKYHQVQEVKPQLSLEDSTSKSKRPQNEKRGQNPNKDQDKKKLEKNTNELFLALKSKNLKKAERLIEQGVNVYARDKVNRTFLHWSAENGYYEVIKSLLSNGADVHAVAGVNQENLTSLHTAAGNGYVDIVRLLLDYGADINAQSKEGITPLYFAVRNVKQNVVEFLLDYGADVNAKNASGNTPLHLAVKKGSYDIVKFLLKNGAEVDTEDQTKATPLHWAAVLGYKSIVELLLDYGAEINAKISQADYTPLNAAVVGGHYGIVALFLEKGADIHTKATGEHAGYTSLHFAVGKNCCPDIVKLLLHYGAKVNTKDALGKTPLSLALEHSYSKIIDLFLADPNINIVCVKAASINKENKEGKEKFSQKLRQDYNLFEKVKKAANEKDTGKLDELLVEIEELLESKNKHGFKPSLNYSRDGNDENTTVEIAIKAGGKLLDLLYDYAEKNISKDTEIFKRLKHAKENSHSKRDLCDVSVLKHSTPDQGFVFSNGCGII